MEPLKQTEDRLRHIKPDVETPAAMDSRILMDSYAAMGSQQPAAAPFAHYKLRRILMKNSIKFTAAAIVIIGVSAIFLFPTNPGSIALADVYAKVQQAQAFMYKMNATMTNSKVQTKMEGTFIISNQYGVKMESTVHMTDPNLTVHQQIYAIPNEKTMMVILPDSKMYQPMEITDNTDIAFEQMKMRSNLREMIGSLVTQKYTELGCSEIDGITVQGFLITDQYHISDEAGESTTTFWVDVDTWLPVKYELNATHGEEESHIVMDQFQWDISVDADDFEYVIPDDYKEMGSSMERGSMKMPELLETTVFDPKTELGEKFLEKIKRKMETVGLDPAKLQESLMRDFTTPIVSLALFRMKLVQEKKDPAYYGDQVTPEDTDAVLMRWKADSGKYKVIFGDLSSVEMEYEDMIKIEPQPETIQP